MTRSALTAALILAVTVSAATASGVIGVTDRNGGTQIWVDSAAFDSQSGFTLDGSVADKTLTGTSYYYPSAGGFAEYSLDFNSADLSGVTGAGTWYFYGRVFQPTNDLPEDGNPHFAESDWLYVKGDPGDGSGATWVADAQASQSTGDDRVFQDMFWFMEEQPDYLDDPQFIWLATAAYDGGVGHQVKVDLTKQFVPEAGVVTYRLEPREPGAYNAKVDLMVWSTVPYEGSDADYWYAVKVPGDGNLDGKVSDADYTIWADNFGATDATWEQGDYNQDGLVTDADYTIWADNFGVDMTVPEPATLSLLGLGAVALIRRRR